MDELLVQIIFHNKKSDETFKQIRIFDYQPKNKMWAFPFLFFRNRSFWFYGFVVISQIYFSLIFAPLFPKWTPFQEE